jgi:hypothetical protein
MEHPTVLRHRTLLYLPLPTRLLCAPGRGAGVVGAHGGCARDAHRRLSTPEEIGEQ